MARVLVTKASGGTGVLLPSHWHGSYAIPRPEEHVEEGPIEAKLHAAEKLGVE